MSERTLAGKRVVVVGASAGIGRAFAVRAGKEGAELLLKHGADPKLGHPCEAQNKCRAEQ